MATAASRGRVHGLSEHKGTGASCRAWLLALLGLGLLSWGALSDAAASAPAVAYFKTPSRNVVCQSMRSPALIVCGIKSGLRPPPPRVTCRAGDPTDRFVTMAATGRPHEPSCAGDPGPFTGEGKARTLHYGHTFHRGGLTCRSATKGLTCRNKSGHGFFLSRARSRTF